MIEQFYGDRNRWFVGRIVNNNDPEERGRVQVRIYGIHSNNYSDLPNYALPWAEVMLPSTEGGVSGIGRIPQMQRSALVFGIFLDGESSQTPLVLGSLNQREVPSNTQRRTNPQNFTNQLGPDGVRTSQELITNYRSSESVDTSRLIIMKWFVDNGLTPDVAAGITGNLEGENSTFNPSFGSSQSTFLDDTGQREQSYGLAQWNRAAGRFQKLVRYANRVNKDPEDFFLQLEFILHELNGRSVDNDGGGDFRNVYNRLERCNTFEGGVGTANSTWIFCRYYEIPQNPEGKLPQREIYARRAYEQYTDSITSANVVNLYDE